MKMQITLAIVSMAAAFTLTGCRHMSRTAAQQDGQLQYTLRVKPEIKRTFHADDSIKIRSITGSAPKLQTGGTYRVVGTCTQQTLKHATLYLGNTAEAGPDAIVASAGSSLFRPLPNGTTKFDISFTLLRPGRLHLTIYDLDNHNKDDNAYAGIYLGDVVLAEDNEATIQVIRHGTNERVKTSAARAIDEILVPMPEGRRMADHIFAKDGTNVIPALH
jgi:hypothetical protein